MASSDWLDQEGGTGACIGADSTPPLSSMLTASFNQDGGCLAIGTNDGFRIYNLAPFAASVNRPLAGSLGKVEMLFRCNLLALVGGNMDAPTSPTPTAGAAAGIAAAARISAQPYAPAHRVLIWDDHVHKAIGELSFRQVVLSVKLRRDAIAVALRDRIYVYHLSDLSLRDKIYTTDNPHGLISLSTTAVQDMVMCCPSVTDGHVRVELYGLRKTVLLEAHESKLRAMALTPDGTQLATASIKGTVVRVFFVSTSALVCEFRRGYERVQMTSLSWSWNHDHLACCSEKGTTHVFSVVNAIAEAKKGKSSSSSWYQSFRKSLPGGGDSLPHSISQIRGVPHPLACCFVPDLPTTVAVVGWDVEGNGILLLSDYSTGDEAARVSYHILCKATSEEEEESLNEGQRRRKRLMGGLSCTNNSSSSSNVAQQGEGEGKLYVGERVEVLENQMKEIKFEEEEEGFLTVLGAGGDEKQSAESHDSEKAKSSGDAAHNGEQKQDDLKHAPSGDDDTDEFQDSPDIEAGKRSFSSVS